MTELLVKIHPKIYKPYIEFSRNGNIVLYANLKKPYTGPYVLNYYGKMYQVTFNVDVSYLTLTTSALQTKT